MGTVSHVSPPERLVSHDVNEEDLTGLAPTALECEGRLLANDVEDHAVALLAGDDLLAIVAGTDALSPLGVLVL